MSRFFFIFCICLFKCIVIFGETEVELKTYLNENILNLDPIEGIYDAEVGIIQESPFFGTRRNTEQVTVAIIKKSDNTYHIIRDSKDCYPDMYITKNSHSFYTFHQNTIITKHQPFTLNNTTFTFDMSYELSYNQKKIVFDLNMPGSNVKVFFVFKALKLYPTYDMFLRAKEEQQISLENAKQNISWSGTGFALDQGHIVTNYHVVEDAKTILIKGVNGDFNTELRAHIVATDKINDLAILKIHDERFISFGTIPYKIKNSISDVGESVWTLGYPMTNVMGDEIKFTDGKISSRTGVQGDMSVYQISVPIQPGNSGGPLFDNYGNIVGITSSGLNRKEFNSENVNYAIKTSYLYNIIESTLTISILPQGTAMQEQALTQKIKLAKNFVFLILCSSNSYLPLDGTGYQQSKDIVPSIQSSPSILPEELK